MILEKVWIMRPQATDRHGNPIGPEPTPISSPGWAVIPRTASEDNDRGEVPIEGYQIIRKANRPQPVSSSDQVICRGEVWDVEGEPAYYAGKATIVFLTRAGARQVVS